MRNDRESELRVIADVAQSTFSEVHEAREEALRLSREIVRNSANTIRATHRGEFEAAHELLNKVSDLARQTDGIQKTHPQIFHAGYIGDALKEYVEASTTLALVEGRPLPGLEELGVGPAPYLNGIADTVGELRRYILDGLRQDNVDRCEELLDVMDAIYTVLVSIDFPEAVTRGLRRSADQTRSLLERTRGDLTLALRQRQLESKLADFQDSIH